MGTAPHTPELHLALVGAAWSAFAFAAVKVFQGMLPCGLEVWTGTLAIERLKATTILCPVP